MKRSLFFSAVTCISALSVIYAIQESRTLFLVRMGMSILEMRETRRLDTQSKSATSVLLDRLCPVCIIFQHLKM